MKKPLLWIIVVIVIFFAGFMTKSTLFSHDKASSMPEKSERKVLYWVAPMDANYRRDKPGKSPMGMDLVPVYADAHANNTNEVTISPNVENQLGVKVAEVQKKVLSREIKTVGYVTINENNIDHVHSYTSGWVRKLFVKSTGEHVQQGQKLLSLFSPELNNAQEEYLLALKNNNPALIRAGKQKLLTLGISKIQVKALAESMKATETIDIFAKHSGIISKLHVREGKFIKPDMDLMTIDDLSSIWIIADVFAKQSSFVKPGEVAIARLSAIPNKTWQGKVDYVYPELAPKTHTLRVRLMFPNPDLSLKPNMYASVMIQGEPTQKTLAVPAAALIRTENGDRVILALGKGRYQAKPVTVGIQSGDYYQVISGVKEGERVVTSAQFLIDSESNVSADLNRMDEQQEQNTNQGVSKEYVGMGIVQHVDQKSRKITLHHNPIDALDMPEMTMTLAVSPQCDLAGLQANDSIHFVLIKKNNQFEIIKIHNMGPSMKAKGEGHDHAHH